MFPRRSGPLILSVLVIVAIAAAIYFAVRKPPLEVELGTVSRGPVVVTIDDEGETRVHDLFAVSAPISGRVQRIELEPGDPVVAGHSIVARMVPASSDFLDPRSRAVAVNDLSRLSSAVAAAEQQVRQARASADLASRDLERIRPLAEKGFASRTLLDRAITASAEAQAAARAAEATLASARAARAAAKAIVADPSGLTSPGSLAVRSPTSGTVMRRLRESETVVPAGTTLVEIGDPTKLEIVTDLLSSDAVKVAAGDAVIIDEWGGEGNLHGRVRRVEPYGFLKLSALGVEEQRVNVIIDLTDPPERWVRLGHGYRVLVRIAEWTAKDALRIPVSALIRDRGRWAVFVVRDGRTKLESVDVEAMNDEYAAVSHGPSPGTAVVLHPSDKLEPNARVVAADSP